MKKIIIIYILFFAIACLLVSTAHAETITEKVKSVLGIQKEVIQELPVFDIEKVSKPVEKQKFSPIEKARAIRQANIDYLNATRFKTNNDYIKFKASQNNEIIK